MNVRKQCTIISLFFPIMDSPARRTNFLLGDDELSGQTIDNIMNWRGIEVRQRPFTLHNKVGIIEGKNGTINRLIGKSNCSTPSGAEKG